MDDPEFARAAMEIEKHRVAMSNGDNRYGFMNLFSRANDTVEEMKNLNARKDELDREYERMIAGKAEAEVKAAKAEYGTNFTPEMETLIRQKWANRL